MTYSTPQPPAAQEDAWWVNQWVDLLNAYRFKKRLERGRNYARQGHILSLEFKESKVHATVQGTANEPYQLSIWIERFSDEDWGFVIDTLSQQALYSAQLLAGEMPDDIEAVFTSNGLSLFPFTLADVKSKCSCPDPKNPCKHIAAVYYQLGDFFREDPFVLFQLRGQTKAQVLEALRQKRQQAIAQSSVSDPADSSESSSAETSAEASAETSATNRQNSGEGLSHSEATTKPTVQPSPQVYDPLANFWTYSEPLDPSLVVITPADQSVLDVIGDMPLATTEAKIVMEHFKALYQSVAQQAMMTALS